MVSVEMEEFGIRIPRPKPLNPEPLLPLDLLLQTKLFIPNFKKGSQDAFRGSEGLAFLHPVETIYPSEAHGSLFLNYSGET